MHESCTDRSDQLAPIPRPDCENNENKTSTRRLANGTKSFFFVRMQNIGLNERSTLEEMFDLVTRHAMLENFRDITVIPIEARK